MTNAEELLRMGLSPTEIAEGYEMASEKALAILPGVWVWVWVCMCVGVSVCVDMGVHVVGVDSL